MRSLRRRSGGLACGLRSIASRRVVVAVLAVVATMCALPGAGSARTPSRAGASPRAITFSTPGVSIAPISGALSRRLEERAVLGTRAALGRPASGLVPSPVDFSYLSGAQLTAGTDRALPSAYDLRAYGRLGPVDDQGTYGTCWAFAALDSLESRLMPDDPQDFSEDNLVLASGFDGDPYQTGGNALEAVAYLARWGGPVTAAEDAYGDASTPRGSLAGQARPGRALPAAALWSS